MNLNQPFFQVALPIMVTMVASVWAMISTNNRRIDELSKRFHDGLSAVNRRLDEIVKRLDRLEDRMLAVENRLTAMEKKVDALEIKAWR